jgi:hypothetical protein
MPFSLVISNEGKFSIPDTMYLKESKMNIAEHVTLVMFLPQTRAGPTRRPPGPGQEHPNLTEEVDLRQGALPSLKVDDQSSERCFTSVSSTSSASTFRPSLLPSLEPWCAIGAPAIATARNGTPTRTAPRCTSHEVCMLFQDVRESSRKVRHQPGRLMKRREKMAVSTRRACETRRVTAP